MTVLRLGKKKLQKIGGSKAVIIPSTWLEHWKNEKGKEPEMVEILFVNGDLRITPVFDKDHN